MSELMSRRRGGDTARAEMWVAWIRLTQLNPLKLDQRTVCSSFFVYWGIFFSPPRPTGPPQKNANKVKKKEIPTMLISHRRTFRNPHPQKGAWCYRTHLATSNQSVFLCTFKKRSHPCVNSSNVGGVTPVWMEAQSRPPRPPGAETNMEQLLVSLDWLY